MYTQIKVTDVLRISKAGTVCDRHEKVSQLGYLIIY